MADESKKKQSDEGARDVAAEVGPEDATDVDRPTPGSGSERPPEEVGDQGEGTVQADAGDDSEEDEPRETKRLTVSRAELNQLSMGELTVHFRNRSVTFAMDGQSAMRMLSVLVGHRHSVTLDLVDPKEASAFSAWVMVDATEVVGAEWNPLPRPSRVAVDPPGDNRARTASRAIYEGRLTEDMLVGTPAEPSDLLPVGAG